MLFFSYYGVLICGTFDGGFLFGRFGEAVDKAEFEGADGVAGVGQLGDVGIVAEGEQKGVVFHAECGDECVALTQGETAADAELHLRLFRDEPFDVDAVGELFVVFLELEEHGGHQGHRLPATVFGAGIDVETGLETGVVEVHVGDVGAVDVAGGKADTGEEAAVGLVVPGDAGTEEGVAYLLEVESLAWVVHFGTVGVEALLAAAPFDTEGEDAVFAPVDGVVVSEGEGAREGAVVQRSGDIVVGQKAEAEAATVGGMAQQGYLAGDGEGLKGGADAGPLVAVDYSETSHTVVKTSVGGVQQQRVGIDLREMDVLGPQADGAQEE